MLKLVIDNTKQKRCYKTCRNNCELFNETFQLCPILKDVDYDNPLITKRCQDFREKAFSNEMDQNAADIIDELFDLLEGDGTEEEEHFVFSVQGEKLVDNPNYPFAPHLPFHLKIPDLYWYVSPCKTFGCWIWNESKRKCMNVYSNVEQVEKGWAKGVYRSPVPLHDHKSSKQLISRVCWYIDEDGWGQYGIIIGNKIGYLVNPKPHTWIK